MINRLEKIKLFIHNQNPRYIYAILSLIILFHFLINHHRILIESDVNKIMNGRIELFILVIFITQTILINKYLKRILKFSVIWFYLKCLYQYYEILTNKTEFFTNNGNTYLMLMLIFGLSTIVSYILFTIIENTNSKKSST